MPIDQTTINDTKGEEYISSKEGRDAVPLGDGEQITVIADQEQRRETLQKRRLVYENEWDDILEEELRRQFVAETFKNIKLMLDTSQNVFRRIIREICTIYKEGSQRELVIGDDVRDVPRWDELQEQLKLDWVLGEAHRLSKATTCCFIRVYYVEEEGKILLELIPPDYVQVDLKTRNPFEMAGFGFRVERPNKKDEMIAAWVYYTPERIYYLDDGGSVIANPWADEPSETDIENPYGIIPVVPFHATAPVRDFWRINWNKDAYHANGIIGVLNTYLNYLVKTQSFKQVYFSADQISKDLLSGIFDPLYPVPLPAGTSAGVLDLQTRVEQIDKVIRNKITSIAGNYAISPENFTISGNVQSGFALKVANRALEEIRDADKLLAAEVEKNLFNVIRVVNNTSRAALLPEDAKLRWNPGEISYPPTWEEEEKKWRFEFDIGVSNPVDYMIEQDPELTRDQAMERMGMIRDENTEIKPKASLAEQFFNRPEKAPGVA